MSGTNAPEQRRYAVMTDSSRIGDNSALARRAPPCDRRSGFWTDDDPSEVWIMDRQTAEEVFARISLNNPRIVRAEKAIARIEAQRDAKLSPAKVDESELLEDRVDWHACRVNIFPALKDEDFPSSFDGIEP
ncbi:hypothetical protein KUV57_12325 [Epibacterium sp. DP7N7-1]|nr:hypothetical protein [Epibacterium sp. DP7N7-1]